MVLSKAKNDKNYKLAKAAFVRWLEDLQTYRILDPACGSGNFLFLGLKVLKDIEHQSHLDAETLGLDREADLVTGPPNMLGLELNEYAAELARVTVWIGELQWRLAHGYEFKTNPVLEPLDCIECRDALLRFTPEASTVRAEPVEADWPKASVVVGNPPFLGGSKKRRELGDTYFEALDKVFAGRVPGGADLVCYWFDKALKAIEINGLVAAGLVSTNSIRGGANRKVLDAICEKSAIFEAWSDEGWVNDGVAVRVSLICFGHVNDAKLDGTKVERILADLTSGSNNGSTADLTSAQILNENAVTCCYSSQEKGSFGISRDDAVTMLKLPNPHGRSNAEVIKCSVNGRQLSQRRTDAWVIDFGNDMPETDAALYEAPFTQVKRIVHPERMGRADKSQAKRW